jgi:ATP-dependent helicase HrpA
VLADATIAAIDSLVDELPWDEAAWRRLRDHVAGHLAERTAAVVAQTVRVLDAAREVERLLALPAQPAFTPARHDVARQLGALVFNGFVTASGAARLPDVERYLRAAAHRLERLPDTLATDRDRMNAIHELEALAAGRRDARWMIEELRVAQFAQGLGVKGQVSAKKIRRALQQDTP